MLGPDVDWVNQVDTGEDVPGHEHRFLTQHQTSHLPPLGFEVFGELYTIYMKIEAIAHLTE
jgi:hypothetical protein